MLVLVWRCMKSPRITNKPNNIKIIFNRLLIHKEMVFVKIRAPGSAAWFPRNLCNPWIKYFLDSPNLFWIYNRHLSFQWNLNLKCTSFSHNTFDPYPAIVPLY